MGDDQVLFTLRERRSSDHEALAVTQEHSRGGVLGERTADGGQARTR